MGYYQIVEPYYYENVDLVLELLANTPGNNNSSWIDTSSYATPATQSNSLYQPVLTNDVFGDGNKGYVFDGVNDHFLVPDSDRFTFSDANSDLPFTIDLSVIFDMSKKVHYLVCKRDGTTSNIEWQLSYNSGALIFSIHSNNELSNYIRKIYPFTPSNNQIYRIKSTYDGSAAADGINLYLNDVSIGVSQSAGTYTKMTNTSSKVTVGAPGFSPIQSVNYDYNLKGSIQYVKLIRGVV